MKYHLIFGFDAIVVTEVLVYSQYCRRFTSAAQFFNIKSDRLRVAGRKSGHRRSGSTALGYDNANIKQR